jgi:hypothetical protein
MMQALATLAQKYLGDK